ncbi:hypothetical protein HWV62_39798 [Athelia sp. TMB]|nr:hypothetical protein HWV62_39798 [Athelia sp. TMB]
MTGGATRIMSPNVKDEDESKAAVPPSVPPVKSAFSTKVLASLFFSQMIAITCIVGGIYLAATEHGTSYLAPVRGLFPIIAASSSPHRVSAISLPFTIIVALATNLIGIVYTIAQRSAFLRNDHKGGICLKYNTFSKFGMNGFGAARFSATIGMFACVSISYTSASLIIVRFNVDRSGDGSGDIVYQPWLTAPPVIALGISLLIQGVIAFWGVHKCGSKVIDCTGPLATTRYLIDNHYVVPTRDRCMVDLKGTLDDPTTTPLPRKLSKRQPSAWSSYPYMKNTVKGMWWAVPFYAIWGGIAYYLAVHVGAWHAFWKFVLSPGGFAHSQTNGTALTFAETSWALSPNVATQAFSMVFSEGLSAQGSQTGYLPLGNWFGVFFVSFILQSFLTGMLMSVEMAINVTRDESDWRAATGRGGADVEDRIVHAINNWRSLFMLAAKPLLPWKMVVPGGEDYTSLQLTVSVNCPQTWYLAIAITCIACITTIITMYEPRGPQPAAYGHIQTLANLIDEWPDRRSPGVLYWGQKDSESGGVLSHRHAGTRGGLAIPSSISRPSALLLSDVPWPSNAPPPSALDAPPPSDATVSDAPPSALGTPPFSESPLPAPDAPPPFDTPSTLDAPASPCAPLPPRVSTAASEELWY